MFKKPIAELQNTSGESITESDKPFHKLTVVGEKTGLVDVNPRKWGALYLLLCPLVIVSMRDISRGGSNALVPCNV